MAECYLGGTFENGNQAFESGKTLTNEQRAHDMAVMMVYWSLNNSGNLTEVTDSVASGKTEIKLNPAKMYAEYYQAFLNEFNSQFSEQ